MYIESTFKVIQSMTMFDMRTLIRKHSQISNAAVVQIRFVLKVQDFCFTEHVILDTKVHIAVP